jgi:hypothetical protein
MLSKKLSGEFFVQIYLELWSLIHLVVRSEKASVPIEVVFQYYAEYITSADRILDHGRAVGYHLPDNFKTTDYEEGHKQLLYAKRPTFGLPRSPFATSKGAFIRNTPFTQVYLTPPWTITAICANITAGQLYFAPEGMIKDGDPEVAKAA